MATLSILGGPNGVGKTTFYNFIQEQGLVDEGLPFVNVDNITRSLGGYNEENFAAASETARALISGYFQQEKDFMIESNLAVQRDYDWVGQVKAAGWRVELFLINTDSVAENVNRIERRVREGGHPVPAHIAADRARMLEVYLKSRFHLFDRVRLVDTTGETALDCGSLEGDLITALMDEPPQWVRRILSLILRLPGNAQWNGLGQN